MQTNRESVCYSMSKRTKSQRLDVTADLLRTHGVTDQTMLLELLRGRNVSITQGILSTYLAELGVTKGMRPGFSKSCYQLPLMPQADAVTTQPMGLISPTVGFHSYTLSGQMSVIHMEPGFAQFTATVLDSPSSSLSFGSVTGYDTTIITLVEETTDVEVIN